MQGPNMCGQCKKDIKTEVCKCVPCDKIFHPGCVKIHKVYNTANELVPCKGKTEVYVIKSNASENSVAGENSSERKTINPEGVRVARNTMDNKIEMMYDMIKCIKNEMVGKDLIKKVIKEIIDEEMDRARREIQHWKEVELGSLVQNIVQNEISKIADTIPQMGINNQEAGVKRSYSEAASMNQEAVLIIRPWEGKNGSSSEKTKRDIKSKIDVSKLGVGITKMKKVNKGAVVVGCENKIQAEMLKEKVTNDLGEEYVIQAPKKRRLKIRIFDVDREDVENEQEFWQKIEEQNGFRKDSIRGKIVHKSMKGGFQRATVIMEVDDETHEKLLKEEKVKIGWNICKVQDYIGILRCFKCCGYYHFAKDCKREETCGKCMGKHATKDCKSEQRNCVNCAEKSKNLKIKNMNSDHSAFDSGCPYYKKELEKLRNKRNSSL